MNNAFCSISTNSHLPQTMALVQSVRQFMPHIPFYILLLDGAYTGGEVEVLTPDDLNSELATDIIKKYRKKSDELRWSLKPVLLAHLLQQNVERVIYLDNDLFFYNDPTFLFEKLSNHSVLLCPHWRIREPEESKAWFHVNFTDGVYNAGFVGVSKQGLEAMRWWARCCAYACEKNFKKGLFDDQKYLDLMPAEFERVGVLNHKGCNVAFWNLGRYNLIIAGDQVIINDTWPVVFIHFTAKLEQEIKQGRYPLLKPLYAQYLNAKGTA